MSSSMSANLGFLTETWAILPVRLLPFPETWPGSGVKSKAAMTSVQPASRLGLA